MLVVSHVLQVRGWVVEASGRVWEALADLTHSLTTNLSHYPQPEVDAYGEGEEREKWVLEAVLEQVAALEDDAALSGALMGTKVGTYQLFT
jgi:hypothetical protein